MSTVASATVASPSIPVGDARSEGVAATRNALTLGGTMVAGMAISMLVRLFLVRLLGPEGFGELRFAETAAEMLFVGLTMGVDTLLRREAAVDAGAAHAYLRAITLLRVIAGAVLLTAIAVALGLTGQRSEAVALFVILALAQFALVLSNSYAALEHASGRVGWISLLTLRFKAVWALLALSVLWATSSPVAFALVFMGVEGVKLAVLVSRHGAHTTPAPRPTLRVAAMAAAASLPFFVNYLAYSLYARLGIWWLGAGSSSQEVGWYGAASTVAAMTMMGMPLISWVLVPASARVGRDAPDGARSLIEGALRFCLLLAVPASAVLGVGAPFWISLLFGAEYQQAVGPLQALAPTFTLAYVATVASVSLIQRDRVRALAAVSVAGLGLSVALNAVLIPWGAANFGAGGAATGAAYATLGTEIVVTLALLVVSRDGFRAAAVARTALALAAATVAAAATMRFISFTWLSIPAAVLAFAGVVAASGAVTATDIDFFRSVLRRTRRHAPASE